MYVYTYIVDAIVYFIFPITNCNGILNYLGAPIHTIPFSSMAHKHYDLLALNSIYAREGSQGYRSDRHKLYFNPDTAFCTTL